MKIIDARRQTLPDLVIPEIMVADGWPVSAVQTVEQCDEAYAYLNAAVAEMEYQLELHDLGQSPYTDPVWPAACRRALKYKRTALRLVDSRRKLISERERKELLNSKDNRLLTLIKGSVRPTQWSAWVAAVEGDGGDHADRD